MMRIRRYFPTLTALLLLVALRPAAATTVVQPTFDKMVSSADYVVRAVVTSVKSEWRDNASIPGQRYIASEVTLDVKEVITGQPPQLLVLELVGGKVGDDELTVEGAPKFAIGDENILFVRHNGKSFFPLVGLMHGYFPVRRDAKSGQAQVMRHNGAPLYSTADLAPGATAVSSVQRGTPMTAAGFSSRIQQEKNALNSREKTR